MNSNKKKLNIYSKINCVNCLTDKMMNKLNVKYCCSGLQMKQVIVDKYGKEIVEKISSKRLLGKKRDRGGYDSLSKFLYNYYGKEKFILLNQNYEKEKKLFDFDPEDKACTRKCLSELKDSLNTIKIDCEYMANKNSKIETDEYKIAVLKYINKFKNYITNEQYAFLQNKWKNELLKVRGTDLFNYDKINDIKNWKVSILKCFKSEIVLYGICNIYDEVINGNKFVKKKDEKNLFKVKMNESKEEEKIDESENEDINGQSSDSDMTEKSFDDNMINS